DTKATAPRSRKPLRSRNTCRRLRPSRSHASPTLMRPLSKSESTSSRENSRSLIDTTIIRHFLPQPQKTEECHLNFARGCHFYIALTQRLRSTTVMECHTG